MMMTSLFMILFLNFCLVDSVHINQDVHVVVMVLLDAILIYRYNDSWWLSFNL